MYFFWVLVLMSLASYGQVTIGVFGNDNTLDGVVQPHTGHTTNKWIKLAELTLNGNYYPAGITVDFFPRNSNHGDSRQQLNVQFRNNGTFIENSHDISLITFHGQQKTLKDVKVVHTSGTGVTNNKLAVWVQIGVSWLSYVPIEVRTYGNVTFEKTNQPCFSTIQDNGTVFNMQAYYGMNRSTFEVAGNIRAKEVKVELENWPDYVFNPEYNLRSLTSVKDFIFQNGHLPDIPAATEVHDQGVALGDMNAKLLQKIEELTLYTLQQEETLHRQQETITTLLERLSQIEIQLNRYETPTP